ncbi:hypothetical protein BCD64_19755 [Nostoc sp. MBR 210]|nr:hypothetical protein BCD64_19755 [Nostoc sp. MBR 210]
MVLNIGDIAFVGFNADGNDNIAFVALAEIPAGETIYFEDNEWNGTGFVDTNESAFSWTATTSVAAGTIVRIDNIGSGTITASTGTATIPVAGRGSNRGLAAGDEVLYAYQGTPGSPTTFITAVANGGFNTANGLLTNTGLTVGTTALDLSTVDDDADIGAYNGNRSGQSSFSAYLPIINNAANWQTQDGTGDQSIDSMAPDVPFSSLAFSITGGNPTVNLSVSSSTGTEAGTTIITVSATTSSPVSGNQTVNLGVSGTGIDAGDYILSNNIITIPDGQTNGSVTFTVVDDALIEGTETAILTISNPSPGITLGTTTQNITITDNDFPAVPIVNLSVSTNAGSEANTTAITVTATASGPVSGNQTVNLGVAGTGITVGDYSLTSNTITIPNGQTSGSVTFIVADDAIAEGTETAILTISTPSAGIALGATTSQNITITNNNSSFLQRVGTITSANGAEISAFDPGSDRLFVVAGSTIETYTISNNGTLALVGTLSTGFTLPPGTQALPNSVAVSNGIVAVAYAIQNTSTNAQQTGQVSFYSAANGTFLNSVAVGALPDMLTFTPDGTRVLVANEGEPNSYGQANSVDPEGSISIIDVSGGVANATVTHATFTSFNSQIDALRAAGVRITGPGATVAQDLEPEYIAVSADGQTAHITLQENNAIAILDIASATITNIVPLGTKDLSLLGNGIDASDRDSGINIQNWPVFGFYQPDAIASFTVNGQTYYITANEGDARDYTGFSEEIRVGASGYVLDPTTFPNAAALKQNANLGRLTVSNVSGDTDGDGDFDRIEAFGARSFSIWDANGNQVFDSGNQFEQITANRVPTLFNSDGTTASFDTRSDNRGPEPEAVTVGVINNRTYAFIGLERTGDVIVYDVTNPTSPSFVQYINIPEDQAVEGLTFISAANSPTGRPLLVTTSEVSRTVTAFEITPPVKISDIQGTAHISPLNGQGVVNVAGIVTAIASNGFYIQDPTPDNNDATSEGIFVFTGTTSAILSARTVGEAVLVSGTVSEFRPGGSSNNLTITQIGNNNSVQSLSVSAWTTAPTTTITPTILGNGGRTIPTQVINDDTNGNVETGGDFDPVNEGIDFYESVEGMLVQINNAIATSPTANFGTSEEIWVLADNGVNATSRTERGGSLITATDYNPERIQIDDLINNSITLPGVNVGAELSTITGVVSYDFNNYEVLVPSAPTVVQPSTLQREVTNLTGTADQLTVATFNVENLDPGDGETQFNNLANRIVNNLRSPDIISLEEIQDNNGAINDSVVDASVTFQTLINAIAQAGGPTYEYRQINPVDDTNGGEPGGNIRVGYLFNPDRVTFVDRPGGGSTTNISVTNVDGTPTLSTSPGLIDPTNPAFNSSRKPLVGEFIFNGQSVYLIGNHFNSKGGDQPLFGPNQPPALNSEAQRQQQATIVRNFVQEILAIDPNANVVVLGDLNDFEFSNPLTTLESAGLTSLIETLPANERYTYNFQGNAQVLDHILASQNLVNNLDGYDVVHINSEFFDQDSDHDPVIARFNLPPANQAPTAVTFNNAVTSINENTNTTNRIKVADISITDDGRGTNNLNLTGADASFFEIDNSVLYLRANTNLDFETRSNYSVTVAVDDPTVGNTPDATANFSLAVNNVNETPIANNDSATTTDIQPVIINVLANDSDPDSNPLTINSFTNPTTGTVVKNNDNTFTYTPEIGFTGTDSFTYTVSDGSLTATATVNLTVTLGSNQINGTNGNNILLGTSRVDVIRGLGGNDIISGLGNNDVIYGGDGSDIIDGGAGNDSLYGEKGNDIVYGRDGNDILNGGAGDDMLLGDGGNDILIGGLGRDILAGGSGRDSFYLNNGARNADIITDFVSGVDSFVISQSEFGFNQAIGTLEPSLFRLGTSATAASDRFIYDRSSGKLFFDQDGIGSVAKVQIAQLSNRPTLSNTDFNVIA